ncbi:MFS transporter, DHA1 family, bicyclomycin/chloramphenicol resistance protein [Corynebacterium pollutisoli]|uniref:MFS transporter, DHA1 family, bicyclomycin/chloramphenicol resistance protein n=1 Tax=Corynebacterium pollutisoli TaxID=1610489 RepID=A0A1X7I926_9CORY|nr:multidrug effflux MFS transporter [Corynebacterium pollutisoli]SMG10870.1 MFS transporter, DHA1 family, bicyclomycin/chloramphenicol resistance protein [Corynebacterium pollutisoli]
MSTPSGKKVLIPPLILGVLALVSAVEPLSINMYLSGLPQLGRDLDLSQAGAQLTLTFFLAGMAIGQLVTGPLSDARGRRGIFLTGVFLLVVATVASALATHAWVLFAARFIMGLAGGTAVVLARAVAGDLAKGPELARVFSLLMLIGGAAPVIGPIVGGLVVDSVGWRGVFWLLVVLNLITALAVLRWIPETMPVEKRTGGGLRPLFTTMGGLLKDRAYVGFTLGFIFSFSTMFAYVSASPFILQEHYGFTPVQFALIFAVNTTGMFIVALTNAKIVKKVGPLRLAKVGNTVLLAATVFLLAAALADANRWFILVGLFVVVASMGINFANNSALAISRAGAVTGSASAFMGSGQFIMAGVLSPLVGVAAAAGMSQPVAMTAVMVATAAIAALGIHSGARQLTR